MKYINKFNKTEDFENAKSWLNELEHYVVYDAEGSKIYSKSANITPKIKRVATFVNQGIQPPAYGSIYGLIMRKDLCKSIKYNGIEILEEPTVEPLPLDGILFDKKV